MDADSYKHGYRNTTPTLELHEVEQAEQDEAGGVRRGHVRFREKCSSTNTVHIAIQNATRTCDGERIRDVPDDDGIGDRERDRGDDGQEDRNRDPSQLPAFDEFDPEVGTSGEYLHEFVSALHLLRVAEKVPQAHVLRGVDSCGA